MHVNAAKDHDAAVSDWQRNAESHDEENYQFLRSLKYRHHGFRPDSLARELHDQAFRIVECTRCANCCKTMDIRFSDDDICRIAAHVRMTVEQFVERYLEPADEVGSYQARQKPCPFLGDDNRCTIYDVRPVVCREYPHTDKKGFASRTILHSSNALTCPAVFWIVEQMKRRAGRQ